MERSKPTERNRRFVLLAAGTTLTGAIAGCSGGGDPTDTDDGSGSPTDGGDGGAVNTGGDDTGGTTPGETTTPDGPPELDATGEVGSNTVEQLEIDDMRATGGGDIFRVTVRFTNTGSRATDPEAYTWGLKMYDAAGDEMASGANPMALALGDGDVGPGESGGVSMEARPDDATAVVRYEVFLSCDGMGADGVYCSG